MPISVSFEAFDGQGHQKTRFMGLSFNLAPWFARNAEAVLRIARRLGTAAFKPNGSSESSRVVYGVLSGLLIESEMVCESPRTSVARKS